jgi:hypothetical protein
MNREAAQSVKRLATDGIILLARLFLSSPDFWDPTESFSNEYRNINLTTHLNLVPRLIMFHDLSLIYVVVLRH